MVFYEEHLSAFNLVDRNGFILINIFVAYNP